MIDIKHQPGTIRELIEDAYVLELGNASEICFQLSKFWQANQHMANNGQLSLSVPKGFYCDELEAYYHLGTGSLGKEPRDGKPVESDFKVLFPATEFLRDAWSELEMRLQATLYRPVLRLQQPKTCLSYHRDLTLFRVHLVIMTHAKAMFIVNDKVERMPKQDYAYLLRTNVYHTAVNADIHLPRLHLTFSGYFN